MDEVLQGSEWEKKVEPVESKSETGEHFQPTTISGDDVQERLRRLQPFGEVKALQTFMEEASQHGKTIAEALADWKHYQTNLETWVSEGLESFAKPADGMPPNTEEPRFEHASTMGSDELAAMEAAYDQELADLGREPVAKDFSFREAAKMQRDAERKLQAAHKEALAEAPTNGEPKHGEVKETDHAESESQTLGEGKPKQVVWRPITTAGIGDFTSSAYGSKGVENMNLEQLITFAKNVDLDQLNPKIPESVFDTVKYVKEMWDTWATDDPSEVSDWLDYWSVAQWFDRDASSFASQWILFLHGCLGSATTRPTRAMERRPFLFLLSTFLQALERNLFLYKCQMPFVEGER